MSLSLSAIEPKTASGLRRSIHDHWRLFIGEGIVLCLLGVSAMLLPVLAGLVATVFLGWLFLLAGIISTAFTIRSRGAPGIGWSILSGLIAICAGIVLLWNPLQSLAILTYVLVSFFLVDGVFVIALALTYRNRLASRWQWMMVNGFLDLALAGIVISSLPEALSWAIGLLVGIDFVFGGASLIAMAISARAEEM